MRFRAHSVTDAQFAEWVAAVKAGNGTTVSILKLFKKQF